MLQIKLQSQIDSLQVL